MLAHLGAPVALIRDSDGQIVYTNHCWDQIFGYARGELVGRHISLVNAPTAETPEARAREILGALRRDGVWRGEVRNVRKDESEFWTQCAVSRWDHPEHGLVWVSVNTDLTFQRNAEDELRDSEQRYRRLFESSPVGLALIDSSLQLALVNQPFADVLGYCRQELQGMTLQELTYPDDLPLCTEMREHVLRGETTHYRLEERLVGRHGGVVPVSFRATVLRGPDGYPVAEIAAIEPATRRAP